MTTGWTVVTVDECIGAHGNAHAWRLATAWAFQHHLATAEVKRNGVLKARIWFDGQLQYIEY